MATEQHDKGRVVHLEVENFKSYKGQGMIGPFKNFTTIIGPNGSGKSNLMDAISFVLGVRTMQLRGNLKELLYKNTSSDLEEDRPRRGQVTLVYETGAGEEVRFTRAINPTGEDTYASQYKLDGRNCTWDAYTQRLESYGILVKARNFLVFQGDIENVAQMSPKDLTNLFEHISGSGALKVEYEEQEERLREAESETAMIHAKKKGISAEKKLKKEQKAEAERHMGLVKELEEMKTRHFLWQAYHTEQDMGEAGKDVAMHQQALAAAEAELKVREAEVEGKKKEAAGLAKERLLLEKSIKKKRGEAEKKNPGMIKAKEQISHASRRLKATERELEAARKKAADHTAKVASLRTQLTNLEDVGRQLTEDAAAAAREKLHLSPDLVAEYNAIKQGVGAKTASLEADRAALATAQDADAEAARLLRDAAGTVDARIAQLEEAAVADEARLTGLKDKAAKTEEERKGMAAERERLVTERRKVEAKRAQLERKLEDTEGSLREAKADNKQSRREREAAETVDALRARYPQQVYGTVTQMAEIPMARYRLALSVVMGKDFDSVIVDTSATAIACIQYVKEQRRPPMTFLPAETIRAKDVNPQLRTLGGTARLALDCLAIRDPRCQRAFQAICGTTLVCDTVDEARQLAYGSDTRHKVVAVDGTSFTKTGLITGGLTSGMEDRAKKWDKAVKEARDVVAGLKDQYEAIRAELNGMDTVRAISERLQAAEAALSRLDNTAHYDAADLKATAQKVKEAGQQIEALKREREAKAPGLAALEGAVAEREGRLAALQRRINAVTDKEFAAFSKRVGVKSIREYEDKHLKEGETAVRRKMEVATQIARVRNQLEYEQRADPAAAVAKREKEIAELTRRLAELETEKEAHTKAAAAVEEALQGLNAQSAALKAKMDDLETAIKALRKGVNAAGDAAAKSRREIAAAGARLERLQAQMADVLEAAARESVTLPTASAAGKGRGSKRGQAAVVSDSEDETDLEQPDTDAMDIDDAPDQQPALSNSTKKAHTKALRYALLDEADRRRSGAERTAREREMVKAMDDAAATLARMAPNMKALEQYEAVKAKEREQLEELEVARTRSRAAGEAFAATRARRQTLFTTAFEHVAAGIDAIYKDLTRSDRHPAGGQAYLSLDSVEDPFLHGVKFSAMPPTKRFRDMELLSGGEKTVAALALLFGIHSFQPSPFFVLDEVDAALDATNVVRVAQYMRRMTREGQAGGFQGIVISLKDIFYEKADALVGVCRDPHHGCSTTLTFDLSRFDAPVA